MNVSTYRAGWTVTDDPKGRYAARNGRVLHQGQMSYHAFIVCLDRIAGLNCWEDIFPGIQAGLSPQEAQDAAACTEEEAWDRALAQSEGRPWHRGAPPSTEPSPPPTQPVPQAPTAPTPALAFQPSLFDAL